MISDQLWRETVKAIGFPEDAKDHLDEPEFEQFVASLDGACQAYLSVSPRLRNRPDIWLVDYRAMDYVYWCKVIADRRQEKAHRLQSQIEYAVYISFLSNSLEELKKNIRAQKKPDFNIPSPMQGYHPERWCEINIPVESDIRRWVEKELQQSLPKILQQPLSWKLSWQVMVLPRAAYIVAGIPSLEWRFKIYVLATVDISVTGNTFTKVFSGYQYQLQADGEHLGVVYIGPAEWECEDEFTTPAVLLNLLAKSAWAAPGVKVTYRDSSLTSFSVEGFTGGTITISDDFRRFLLHEAAGGNLVDSLLAHNIIDSVTAQLVKENENIALPVSSTLPLSLVNGSDISDVIAKLEGMGYKKEDIDNAMKTTTLSQGLSLDEKIQAVMKNLPG